MLQRTLKKAVTITGVGLHSGERVKLSLIPAEVDKGIMFRRVDLKEDQNRIIKLNPYLINDTRLSSTIVTSDGIRIGTIEHLMSAFCALGIDNVLVELNAPEIPIMDGSSLSFIHVIKEAGVIEQKKEKVFLKIKKSISIDEGDKKVEIIPHDGFIVSLTIEFDHPVFNRSNQTFQIDFSHASYIDEIARARTFGFMQEIELMRTHNLGLGGNLNNAIVIDDESILNPEGLRYPDEFVRHKVLDAIGDLYVIGHQIIGHFQGYKSGHAINNSLLRKILESDDNYELVTFPNDEKLPDSFHYL
ncbi:MAG: UDP-3-O-acyl-N-acetylglucosamine deacetylase [Neisseriaceae bacterium]|nr:UDP-3-O-acyl-N-acetylglucosamine deacetylase [Neisseriaceae bacterium PsAf]MCV2502859.1 UDP-3-O-acyl-N-acetylglucosamine deacetylase [Neisseriaceae bacterium]MCV2508850.1 UDP-3-O-acyl-N-acetylglucosamine deacetylase [Neisseriaceae bacterium]